MPAACGCQKDQERDWDVWSEEPIMCSSCGQSSENNEADLLPETATQLKYLWRSYLDADEDDIKAYNENSASFHRAA